MHRSSSRSVSLQVRPLQVSALRALRFGLDPQFAFEGSDQTWTGVDVVLDDALQLAPSERLFERWKHLLLDQPVIDSNGQIASDVIASRDFNGAGLRLLDPACASHPEALDFSTSDTVKEKFFYLHDLLHRRRINQMADVVAEKAREAIALEGKALVLEIGPGPAAVQRATSALLSSHERSCVRFIAVDVSIDLLRYGLYMNLFDEGIVANIATFDVNEMELELGAPDIIVACEILEHVESSASVVDRGLIEWARRSHSGSSEVSQMRFRALK